MARRANDGTEFTNQMSVNRYNARLAARGPEPAKPHPAQPDHEQRRSIEDDPAAREHIEALKSAGYSPEEVAECMRGGGEASDAAQEAVSAAPLQIPGLR